MDIIFLLTYICKIILYDQGRPQINTAVIYGILDSLLSVLINTTYTMIVKSRLATVGNHGKER